LDQDEYVHRLWQEMVEYTYEVRKSIFTVDELLSESSVWSRVSANAIFESNLLVTSDQCNEIITDEEAVLRRLSRFWWIFGREECKMNSSQFQNKEVKLTEIYSYSCFRVMMKRSTCTYSIWNHWNYR